MPALRPLHFQKLIAVFERSGFTLDRQQGDHLIYIKAGIKRPLVIPMYHEVPVFIIRNLLRTAGMSREEFLDLAAKVRTPDMILGEKVRFTYDALQLVTYLRLIGLCHRQRNFLSVGNFKRVAVRVRQESPITDWIA